MTLEELVPSELHDAYLSDDFVNQIFHQGVHRGYSREKCLTLCVVAMAKRHQDLFKECMRLSMLSPQPYIIMKGSK
jgi:hypothetical protein